jgi:hypothetical protein
MPHQRHSPAPSRLAINGSREVAYRPSPGSTTRGTSSATRPVTTIVCPSGKATLRRRLHADLMPPELRSTCGPFRQLRGPSAVQIPANIPGPLRIPPGIPGVFAVFRSCSRIFGVLEPVTFIGTNGSDRLCYAVFGASAAFLRSEITRRPARFHRAAPWPSGKRSPLRRLRPHDRARSLARRSAARPPKASANRRRQARRAAARVQRPVR